MHRDCFSDFTVYPKKEPRDVREGCGGKRCDLDIYQVEAEKEEKLRGQ